MTGFSFILPSLPKDWYLFIERTRAEHGLSRWQCVLWALSALDYCLQHAPDAAAKAAAEIKARYPETT